MTPVPQRTCAIPDLGGELLDPLRVTEEVLLGLAARECEEAGRRAIVAMSSVATSMKVTGACS